MSPFPDANSSFCHPKFIFSRVPSNRKSTTQVPKPLPASKTSAQAICFSPSPHQHGNKPQLSTFTLMSILQQQPEGAFKNENHQRPFLSNASSIPGYSWDKIQKLQQDLQNLDSKSFISHSSTAVLHTHPQTVSKCLVCILFPSTFPGAIPCIWKVLLLPPSVSISTELTSIHPSTPSCLLLLCIQCSLHYCFCCC